MRLLPLFLLLGTTGMALGQDHGPYDWPTAAELVEESHSIVAGEVTDTHADWSADRTEIFTTVTLRVEQSLAGPERTSVRFRVPGGTVGDMRLMVTHSPQFAVGERVLVFLAGAPGRLPQVTAGEAGKRSLATGENGERLILPPITLEDGVAPALSTLEEFRAYPALLENSRR